MFVMSNLPVLIIFCPLLGALVCPVISWFNRKAGRWTVTAMAGLSLAGLGPHHIQSGPAAFCREYRFLRADPFDAAC